MSLGYSDSTRGQIQEPGFKEQFLATIPRTISKTTRFEDALEDIPTRQTYSSTDRHSKISSGVLADRFGIGTNRENATLKSNVTKRNEISYTPNQQEV